MSSPADSVIRPDSTLHELTYCDIGFTPRETFSFTSSSVGVGALRRPRTFQRPREEMTFVHEEDLATFGAALASTSSTASVRVIVSFCDTRVLAYFWIQLFRGFHFLAGIYCACRVTDLTFKWLEDSREAPNSAKVLV